MKVDATRVRAGGSHSERKKDWQNGRTVNGKMGLGGWNGRPSKERQDGGDERGVEGRGDHRDEGNNAPDDLSGEPVKRRREGGTWRTKRSTARGGWDLKDETVGGEGRTRVGRRVPTGHCIPSELSIQWRDEQEGYIPSERREKGQRNGRLSDIG